MNVPRFTLPSQTSWILILVGASLAMSYAVMSRQDAIRRDQEELAEEIRELGGLPTKQLETSYTDTSGFLRVIVTRMPLVPMSELIRAHRDDLDQALLRWPK